MPTPIDTVYIIHNSHTDIGFTHPQPIVWERHRRGIDNAVEFAWADRHKPLAEAFRWTIETTAPLMHWFGCASSEQREKMRILNHEGRIDIGAMFLNLTPLCDTAELIMSLQPINTLRRDFGLEVRSAMNCDVNGQNWPLVDILLDAGISGYSMGINEAWGGAPLYQPCPFWWESPSGRRLLVWNGWIYGYVGRTTGLTTHDADKFTSWWPRVAEYLAEHDYPLTKLMIQASGDNILPDKGLPRFVEAWNAAGRTPYLRMSTLSEWLDVLREQAVDFPVYRGDWTDYWNFGSISSAREQGIHRDTRTRLMIADGLRAVAGVPTVGSRVADQTRTQFGPAALRNRAIHNLLVYDEHTWGSNVSVREPYAEGTLVQWAHKAAYAAVARSCSNQLLQDGMAWLANQISAMETPGYLIYNPLPWERTVTGPVSIAIGSEWVEPTKVPGFGYQVVQGQQPIEAECRDLGLDESIETHRYRIELDQERGGIRSWWDKKLSRELVDQEAPYPLVGFVHETVADENHPWPRKLIWSAPQDPHPLAQSRSGWHPGWPAKRTQPNQVVRQRITRLPWGIEVEQVLAVPNFVSHVNLKIRLPYDEDYLDCEATWVMGQETRPEATYLAFPFNVPDAECHLDLGPQSIQPEYDQLPGVCRDYFTVQRWVDFSNSDYGITVACPINPLVQLGDFHFGDYQDRLVLKQALMLGWITNNYWGVNFRAHQPGQVTARYRLLPHQHVFCETSAHHFGLETSTPCLFHRAQPKPSEQSWPYRAQLLRLPDEPVVVLQVRSGDASDEMLVTLVHAADTPGTASLAPGLIHFARAYRCDIFGNRQKELLLQDGVYEFELEPRALVTICLQGVESTHITF